MPVPIGSWLNYRIMKKLIIHCSLILFWGWLSISPLAAQRLFSSNSFVGNKIETNLNDTLTTNEMSLNMLAVIRGLNILDEDCDEVYDPTDRVGVGFVFDLIDHNTGDIIATQQSDASGRFEFTNLMAGDYTLRVKHSFGWFSVPVPVTLTASGVQSINYFNCRIELPTAATCVYGDTTAIPANTNNEKGLAIVPSGGLFSPSYTHMFSSTNINYGVIGDENIVGKRWVNGTSNSIDPNATLNDFVDSDPGAHRVENLYVVKTNMPCHGGAFAGVGTINNGVNKDVFYTEYNTNGVMTFYTDVTSTAAPDREVVHELIKADNNELIWVGTQRAGSTFPNYDELMLSRLNTCTTPVTNIVFGFRDNTGQVPVTGRSVLSLETPLPGYPNAKYAVTGSIGNKAYLFLLGANFNQQLTKAYDIDGASNTHEEGIRIRRIGDELVILGNSTQIGPRGLVEDQKIFMLKLGFPGQPGLPTVRTNKLYDLPGGAEEIVDAEVDNSGDLILTGTSAILNLGITNSGDPENQQTFLMGLDPFGNQLWLNQVLFSEGSEPTDLLLGGLFGGGIQVSGSCWTNELINSNGIFVNLREFDEMLIRADLSGALAFNSGCATPLVASVTKPVSVASDFIADADTPMFTIIDGGINIDEYFPKEETCPERDGFNCEEDLRISSSILESDTMCCFQLDYFNDSPVPFYELCLRARGTTTFTDISVDPTLTYTIVPPNNEIRIRSATSPALRPGQIQDAINFCVNDAGRAFGINYFWKDNKGNIICEEGEELECPSDCTADFTWTADCGTIQLNATASGTGPFTYEWDINCDDDTNPELTGQSTSWTVNSGGVYDICLKVTDTSTGCVARDSQQVFVELGIPTLTCPPNITISTDPGLCTATHQLVEPIASDDCTTMFSIRCSLAGATTGTAVSPVTLNKGITTVNCATEDENGQSADCSYTITVEDNEAPVITCTAPAPVTVAACEGGAFPVLADPVVTDNCPMVKWTSTHTLGDFYACGTTEVTYTATDMAGNQSSCIVPVVVNCQCAEVENTVVECTDVDDQIFFSVNVRDLAGADPAGGGCTITVTSPQAGITISNPVVSGTGPDYLVSGLIDMAAPPVPTNIRIIVTVNCVCFDGSQVNCSIPVNLPVPCCKEIDVEPQEVCKTGGTVQIPLAGCNTLYDVQQVRWFVADAPCTPTTNFGTAFQVTNGCAPLNLSPQYHNGDVCVYAEVTMGAAAGACRVLRSNVATITLCEPLGCKLDTAQAYCWSGTPITPTLLTLNLDTTECRDSIRWFDPQGNPIPAANDQFAYQPPPLSFTLANTECAQSFTYRVEVSNQCGTQSCSVTIRLDNADAPVGTLSLLAPDVNPLCAGEDAILEYTPECAGDPERWDWFQRPDASPTYSPITTNGDRNPLYYSNRLYEDTWFKVEKTNGTCPTDEIEFLVDIIAPTTVTSFTAAYDDACSPTQVDFSVDFMPNPADSSCSYNITWFRNGQVISTSNGVTNSPATLTYSSDTLNGNYYCTVENSCCAGSVRSQVVSLKEPMEVFAVGPCFRCKQETIQLTGVVKNPPAGLTCTYQWYNGYTELVGETGPNLVVDPSWYGPFKFYVICTDGIDTCIVSSKYELLQCGTGQQNIIDVGVNDLPLITGNLFPNPTTGQVTIELDKVVHLGRLEVFDAQGKLVHVQSVSNPARIYTLKLDHLPKGIYIVQALSDDNELLVKRVVKQ